MKKALKITAISFLIASMIIPAKIAMSSGNKSNTIDKNLIAKNTDPDSDKICIKTSLDDGINADSGQSPFYTNPDYPTVAKIGIPITLDMGPSSSNYTVKIEGENYYEMPIPGGGNVKKKIKVKDNEDKKEIHCYECTWIPKQVGIFNIVAYSDNKVAAIRKVYVNDFDNKSYLQLESLKTSSGKDKSTSINATVAGSVPSTYLFNPGEIKIDIGEPLVWSRTVLTSNLGLTPLLNRNYSISENQGTNGFKFNNGIYEINASVKGIHSIEYEDAKAISYKKSGLDNINLTLTQGKSEAGKAYEFTADVGEKIDEDTKNNLDYAFILWDYRGYRVVKGYSKDNTFNFTPDLISNGSSVIPQGNYRIYVRVKQHSQNDRLPNSYEAETYCELHVDDSYNNNDNIKINKIMIDAYETKDAIINNINLDTNYKKHECYDNYALSHEMNVIKVVASQSSGLKYKVYAIHDGCCRALCDYSDSNYIPFYPKSSGEYKLIILAKSSVSGSEDARLVYDLTVTDNINEACKN